MLTPADNYTSPKRYLLTPGGSEIAPTFDTCRSGELPAVFSGGKMNAFVLAETLK